MYRTCVYGVASFHKGATKRSRLCERGHNKVMKKWLGIMLVFTLVIAGCGSKESTVANVPVSDITSAILANNEKAVHEVDLKTDADFASMLNINPEDLAEGIVVKAMMNVHADELIVLKAADDSKIETLKKALEDEGNAQEQNWSTYLPEQYEIVKNRVLLQNGPYLMLYIGPDTDVAEQKFNELLQAK